MNSESERSPGGRNDNPLQFLAWGIPYREEPCGLQFIDLQKLDMTYATDHEEPRPRGATPHPRSGVVDKTSYPTSEVRAVDDRSYHTSKEWRLHGCRKAWRSYSMFKVRRGSCEEIPTIQGKQQWLCFAGAAGKRYPTSKVRETQVRW